MGIFEIVAYAEPVADSAAANTAGAVAEVSPIMQGVVTFLPIIAIMALMYFMMIRPQRKREKETKSMIDAMKVGDKVVTIGGIMGKVTKIKDNTVVIETGNVGNPAEKSYVKMERDSIKTVEQKLSN